MQDLAADICSPLYKADVEYSSAVSLAISTATSSAIKELATRDPLKVEDYPPCGVRTHSLFPKLSLG